MPHPINRRKFLKAGLLTAGSIAAGTIRPQATAQAAQEEELCTLLDIRKCIACEACVEACREVNADKFPVLKTPMPTSYPTQRVKIADWSSEEKRAVTDRLTPYNWLYIQHAEGTYRGEPFELAFPRRCMHCRNAPCSKLCPFGAAYKQSNGIIRIHPEICLGGAKCRKVCPWHIPERQSGVGLYLNLLPQFAGNGTMYKCDRCFDRVAAGELPACIEVCPESVQEIGPRSEMLAKAHRLAEEINGFIYGAYENGGTNTIYVSPVPFKKLNKAIEKGPGRPHCRPVADAMQDANNLFAAVAIAPLAGAIGAAARIKIQQNNQNHKDDTP